GRVGFASGEYWMARTSKSVHSSLAARPFDVRGATRLPSLTLSRVLAPIAQKILRISSFCERSRSVNGTSSHCGLDQICKCHPDLTRTPACRPNGLNRASVVALSINCRPSGISLRLLTLRRLTESHEVERNAHSRLVVVRVDQSHALPFAYAYKTNDAHLTENRILPLSAAV